MRIGILTGGGDVPGLNACIKTITYRGIDEGCQVLGIRRGWAGLLEVNPDDAGFPERSVVPLLEQNTRTIDRTGGTFLHTSRTNPARVPPRAAPEFLRGRGTPVPGDRGDRLDFTPHVLRVIERLGLDLLIPIGGDDTLSYAVRLAREGVPVIAIPKTMDNDVFGTDYCIGFSTAVTRSVDFIHQLRTSAGSHERIAIVELFGRNCGETALLASYLAGVERALISEVPFDPERLARFVLEDKRANPSNYVMVTMSEGARMEGGSAVESGEEDAFGHRKLGGIGERTGEILKRLTGEDVLYQPVRYLMRSGAPDSLDLMVAVNFANMAVTLARRGERGLMVALRQGTYTTRPIATCLEGTKRVDTDELYDATQYRPKLRHVEGKPMFLY
jgi:6-phosphofructokinase 1